MEAAEIGIVSTGDAFAVLDNCGLVMPVALVSLTGNCGGEDGVRVTWNLSLRRDLPRQTFQRG